MKVIISAFMLKASKKKLVTRLSIVRGQVEGLQRMVQDNQYCVDIITQSLAIQKSLQSFNRAMLKNHFSEHVAHQFRHGGEKKAVEELLKIYELSAKQ